jgi:hypothetical protein
MPGDAMGMLRIVQCPTESNNKAAHISELCVRARPWYLITLFVVIKFLSESTLADESTNRLSERPLRREDINNHPFHLLEHAI